MIKSVLTVAIIALTTGCASIVSDSTYSVAITGQDDTHFKLKNSSGIPISQGYTPMSVSLKAGDGYFSGADYVIESSSDCGTAQTPVTSSLDGWYIGNLLFGGLIGFLLVDPATGAMWKLPEVVNVNVNNCGTKS